MLLQHVTHTCITHTSGHGHVGAAACIGRCCLHRQCGKGTAPSPLQEAQSSTATSSTCHVMRWLSVWAAIAGGWTLSANDLDKVPPPSFCRGCNATAHRPEPALPSTWLPTNTQHRHVRGQGAQRRRPGSTAPVCVGCLPAALQHGTVHAHMPMPDMMIVGLTRQRSGLGSPSRVKHRQVLAARCENTYYLQPAHSVGPCSPPRPRRGLDVGEQVQPRWWLQQRGVAAHSVTSGVQVESQGLLVVATAPAEQVYICLSLPPRGRLDKQQCPQSAVSQSGTHSSGSGDQMTHSSHPEKQGGKTSFALAF